MMADEHEQGLDPRIQAYLDGELDRTEREALEREMRNNPRLSRQVAALRGVDEWLHASRAAAPPGLAAGVERKLAATGADRRPARAAAQPAGQGRSRERVPWLRSSFWRWALPAAGAVAAAVLLIILWGSENVEEAGPGWSAPGAEHAGADSPAGQEDRADIGTDPEMPASSEVSHRFTLRAAGAEQVCLVGSFNRWEVCATPLAARDGDLWQVSIDLPPGRYEYMFVVDDRWTSDPQAAVHVDDGFGHRNALLIL